MASTHLALILSLFWTPSMVPVKEAPALLPTGRSAHLGFRIARAARSAVFG